MQTLLQRLLGKQMLGSASTGMHAHVTSDGKQMAFLVQCEVQRNHSATHTWLQAALLLKT